jgi:hypothetical protein
MKQVDPKIVVPAGQFSDVVDQVPGALKIATSICLGFGIFAAAKRIAFNRVATQQLCHVAPGL